MLVFSSPDADLLFPGLSMGAALALDTLMLLVDIFFLVLMIVGEWKLFKKFGEKPWKALIPYYSIYIVFKHTWKTSVFYAYLVAAVGFDLFFDLSEILVEIMPSSDLLTIFVLLSVPFGIVAAIYNILASFRLAESFGKGRVFALGLICFYSLFVAILGIGKSQYLGNSENLKNGEAEISEPTEEAGEEGAI